jgi:hypothetical protein
VIALAGTAIASAAATGAFGTGGDSITALSGQVIVGRTTLRPGASIPLSHGSDIVVKPGGSAHVFFIGAAGCYFGHAAVTSRRSGPGAVFEITQGTGACTFISQRRATKVNCPLRANGCVFQSYASNGHVVHFGRVPYGIAPIASVKVSVSAPRPNAPATAHIAVCHGAVTVNAPATVASSSATPSTQLTFTLSAGSGTGGPAGNGSAQLTLTAGATGQTGETGATGTTRGSSGSSMSQPVPGGAHAHHAIKPHGIQRGVLGHGHGAEVEVTHGASSATTFATGNIGTASACDAAPTLATGPTGVTQIVGGVD